MFLTQTQAKQQYDRQYATANGSNAQPAAVSQPSQPSEPSPTLLMAMAAMEIKSLHEALTKERERVKQLESGMEQAISYIRDVLCGDVPSPAVSATNVLPPPPLLPQAVVDEVPRNDTRKRTWTAFDEEGRSPSKNGNRNDNVISTGPPAAVVQNPWIARHNADEMPEHVTKKAKHTVSFQSYLSSTSRVLPHLGKEAHDMKQVRINFFELPSLRWRNYLAHLKQHDIKPVPRRESRGVKVNIRMSPVTPDEVTSIGRFIERETGFQVSYVGVDSARCILSCRYECIAIYIRDWINANAYAESFIFDDGAEISFMGKVEKLLPVAASKLFFVPITINNKICPANDDTRKFVEDLMASYNIRIRTFLDTKVAIWRVVCQFDTPDALHRAYGLFHNTYLGEFRLHLTHS